MVHRSEDSREIEKCNTRVKVLRELLAEAEDRLRLREEIYAVRMKCGAYVVPEEEEEGFRLRPEDDADGEANPEG